MIEYANLFLLLTMFGSTCYVYYKLKKFFYLISILLDSKILDQLTNLEKNVNSEVTKPKRSRKKKTDAKINEVEENDVRDKRERLITCVLSGNSKQYLGKEYTKQQINEMDSNDILTLSSQYESVLSAQMTKSLGKSVRNLYSNVTCSVLGIGNQQDLSDDLECDPFLNTALQRFTCDLYYHYGAFLAPVSVSIITGKHYANISGPKLNGKSENRNCESAKQETVMKQKNPLRIEQGKKLVEYNCRKKEEVKRLNEQITEQDGREHKPKPYTNNYVYVGGLSVFGLAIGGYLLYSKLKKPEQNLIDVPPPPVAKTNTEPKRDILEML